MEKTLIRPAAERGDMSRRKLIDAAIRIFGQYGFEGASTRQLAREAGANIAAIPYYFGGKEGLYLASIEAIVEFYRSGMGNVILHISEALAGPSLSDAQYRALLEIFVREMTGFILGGREETINISRIVIREQLDPTPTPAFDLLYDGLISNIHDTLALLLSHLIGMSAGDPALRLVTQALLGQIFIFKSARGTTLRNMGWKGFGEAEIAQVNAVIQAHVTAIIDGYRRKQP